MRGLLRWSYIGRKSGKITGIIRVLWSEFENAGLGKRIGVSGVAGIIKILIRSDLEDHQRLRSPVFRGEKLVHVQMSENRFCNKTTARDQDLRNRFARLACCIPNLDLEEFSAWAFFVNFINLVNGCRTNLQTVGEPMDYDNAIRGVSAREVLPGARWLPFREVIENGSAYS